MEILKGRLGFKGNKGDTGEVGTPVPYEGTFDELKNSSESKYYNYIILDNTDTEYVGHWVYYDRTASQWKDGGIYESHYLTTEMKNRLNAVEDETTETTVRQDLLEQKYDEQIENIASGEYQNAEIVDARAGQSTLGNLLKKKMYFFTNVSNMKNCLTLIDGDVVQTLGYYSENDGGEGLYKIVNDNTLVDDGGFVHELTNGLKAKLIVKDNTVNIRQLGGQSEQNTNYSHLDIKNAIQIYLNNLQDKKLKLYIPSGIWCCSELLISKSGFNIFGDKYFNYRNSVVGTIITSLENNQRYIWKVGGHNDFSTPTQAELLSNYAIENIFFQSTQYSNYYTPSEYFNLDYALIIDFAQMGILNGLNIGHSIGGAIQIISSWEITGDIWVLRGIGGFDKPKIDFKTPYGTIGSIGCNISAINIDKIYFEGINGQYISIENNAKLTNSQIGYINAENTFASFSPEGTIISKNSNPTIELPLFEIENGEIIIDDISIQNFSKYSYEIGNDIYNYSSIFETKNDIFQQVIVNNIQVSGFIEPMYILKAKNNNYRNSFLINTFMAFDETNRLSEPTNINNYMSFDIFNYKIFKPQTDSNPTYLFNNRILAYKNVFRIQNTLDKYITTDSEASNPLRLVASNQKSTASYKPLLRLLKSSTGDLIMNAKGDDGVSYKIGLGDGSNRYVFRFTGTGSYTNYSFKTISEINYNNLEFNKLLTLTDDTSYDDDEVNPFKIDYFIFE